MKGQSTRFVEELGACLAASLGPDWSFTKSRKLLSAPAGAGRNVVVVSAMTQYSPDLLVYFHFGRAFDAARPYAKLATSHCPYEIHQNTHNLRRMTGTTYAGAGDWRADASEPPAQSLVDEAVACLRDVAMPFFERFCSVESARDAIAHDDPWCLGGWTAWPGLLALDAALGDLDHFEVWCRDVVPEHDRARALGALAGMRASVEGAA